TTNPGVAVTTWTQAQIDANQVVYVHDGSNTTSDSITFTVDDGQGNALAALTFALTVTPVNDAPTATNLSAGETYAEDASLNLTDIVVSDTDSGNVTVTLTLSDVAAGSLSTGTSGAVTSTFAGGVWTASGAIADVNALLAGVTFTPSLAYISNFTITTSVDDGVAAPITGVKNMTFMPANSAPIETILNPDDTKDTPPNDIIDIPDSEEDIIDDQETDDPINVIEDALKEEKTILRDMPLAAAGKTSGRTKDAIINPELTRVSEERNDTASTSPEVHTAYENNIYSPSRLMNYKADETAHIDVDLNTTIEILRNAVESIEGQEKIIIKTVVGGTVILSVGLATWILRGGSLAASVLTTMPIWKGFDPLNVLPLTKKERRKKIKELRASEDDEKKTNREVANLLDPRNKKDMKNNREDDKS
ncbi:MAG: hypothetical protein AMK70_03075, partial [Nitrospira bacterium SG8_35_1]